MTLTCTPRHRVAGVLFTSPCNPRGLVHGAAEAEAVAGFVTEHGLHLIWDAVYAGTAFDEVRKTPSWPRSWAHFSLLQLYSRRNTWANLSLLDQPNPCFARGRGRRRGAANVFARGAAGLPTHGLGPREGRRAERLARRRRAQPQPRRGRGPPSRD
jgi:bifunctional pyridoxal-dependent enzyme with beta-cystathionase and maltose regulon repressor activities